MRSALVRDGLSHAAEGRKHALRVPYYGTLVRSPANTVARHDTTAPAAADRHSLWSLDFSWMWRTYVRTYVSRGTNRDGARVIEGVNPSSHARESNNVTRATGTARDVRLIWIIDRLLAP